MNPNVPDRSVQGDQLDAVATGAMLSPLLITLLPVALAWLAAPWVAEHPNAWRKLASRHRVLLALIVAATLGALAVGVLVTSGPLLIALTIVELWVLATPLALLILRWRLSRIATALDEGRLMPSKADRVRRAIWQGTGLDATYRAQRSRDQGSQPILGYLYDDDRRDVITRKRDRRHSVLNNRRQDGWIRNDTVRLPMHEPPRALVCGGSGSGKTVLLHNVVSAALQRGDSVVFLDCKGDREGTQQLIHLAADLGVPCREWRVDGGAPFQAWHGSVEDCIAKMDILLGSNPTSSAAKHYRARTLAALRAVTSPGGAVTPKPWMSTADLRNRLQQPQHWVTDSAMLAALRRKHQGEAEHQRVLAEVDAAISGLGSCIDGHAHPHGWSWETTETPGLFIATVPSTNDAALRAASLMLKDLDTYRETRQSDDTKKTRRLVILDEAGVLLDRDGAPPVATLSEQLRSANIGLIIAGQSVNTLGEAAYRLLESGVEYIVGKMPNPEEFVTRAGTRRAPEVGHQADHQGLTGVHATREQAVHRLDPDRVRELPRGHFGIYTNSQVYYFAGLPPTNH